MLNANRKRTMGYVLAVVLAGALLAFAGAGVVRWHAARQSKGPVEQRLPAQIVVVSETPVLVQETAQRMTAARVGFAVPGENATYMVISTGEMGEKVALDSVKMGSANVVDVFLRKSETGARLLVVKVGQVLPTGSVIRYHVDDKPAAIPSVVNRHNVVPVALPGKGNLAVALPRPGSKVTGGQVVVSGFARLGMQERFTIQVLSDGKGRVLGEVTGAGSAALAPDWGSFRVTVPLAVPAGVTSGTVFILNEVTGEKYQIPVTFSSK